MSIKAELVIRDKVNIMIYLLFGFIGPSLSSSMVKLDYSVLQAMETIKPSYFGY